MFFSDNRPFGEFVQLNCYVGRVYTKLSTYRNINNICLKTLSLFNYLQNHIAVGRMLRTIESHSGTKVPYNSLRKAFYHFCALKKYSYSYFCYRCGHHPSVVIADANWKVAFELPGDSLFKMYFRTFSKIYPTFTCSLSLPFLSQLPVHLLKRPEKHNITPQDTEVNVAARWDNLEKEIIASGFCDGKHNMLIR